MMLLTPKLKNRIYLIIIFYITFFLSVQANLNTISQESKNTESFQSILTSNSLLFNNWNASWTSSADSSEWGNAIAVDSLDNTYVAGFTETEYINSDIYLLKYDSSFLNALINL